MRDSSWADNVLPLISLLTRVGLDPIAWAIEPDFDELEERLEALGIASLQNTQAIHFACGYLQATGNLTHIAWSGQVSEYLA